MNDCFGSRVGVRTPKGIRRIADIMEGDRVLTYKGFRKVRYVTWQAYDGLVYFMDKGEIVTPNHLFMSSPTVWTTAEQIFRNPITYKGTVWNMEIDTDSEEERNYVLANGRVAHNHAK